MLTARIEQLAVEGLSPSQIRSLVGCSDLPCSHETRRRHAGGTNPGSTPSPLPIRDPRFCLPRRGIGSAASTTIDFGANPPFTCVPAYPLPVYASQCPLPVHHARLGTRLLAKLYRGRHLRRLNFMRFQGAILIEPDGRD